MPDVMSPQEWIDVVTEMETPIDFEKLIADGALKRRSKTTYLVLDRDRVPKHVWRHVRSVTSRTVKGKSTMIISISDRTGTAMKMLSRAVGAKRAQDLVRAASAKASPRIKAK